MKFRLLSLICIAVSVFAWVNTSFALDGISCPAPKSSKLEPTEIQGKIEACQEARKNGTTSSITDYSCPAGDFTFEDSMPINDYSLPYIVAVSLLFREIDNDALGYICTLREMREKDSVKWTEDIRKNLDITSANTSSTRTISERYLDVCNDFSYIPSMVNTEEKTLLDSRYTYPALCSTIAKRKIAGWKNLAYMVASDSISKSWQNDKDVFVDKIKTKYSRIIDKLDQYKRIASRIWKNMTSLPKDSIKGGG